MSWIFGKSHPTIKWSSPSLPLYFFSAPPPHLIVIEPCLSKYWKFNHLLLSCHRPGIVEQNWNSSLLVFPIGKATISNLVGARYQRFHQRHIWPGREDLLFVTKDLVNAAAWHIASSHPIWMLILRRYFHLSRPFPQTHRPFACSGFDDTKSPPWIVAPSSRTAPWPALARYCTITPAAERSTSGDRVGRGGGTKCWDSSVAHLVLGSVQFVTSWLMPFLRRPEL